MSPEEIKLNDAWRILIGEVPWAFLIEIVIRTAFLFLVLLTSMRMLGKRMASQLTKNELIAMSALAAAIGVPIQAPDRGLIPSLIIAMIVVLIGRLVSWVAFINPKFERLSQDALDIVVEESVLQFPVMQRMNVTRERIFAYLRSKGIVHLGEVKRVYLEAGGFFTIVKYDKPHVGLKLVPYWDHDFIKEQSFAHTEVCGHCGYKRDARHARCPRCRQQAWEPACATGT